MLRSRPSSVAGFSRVSISVTAGGGRGGSKCCQVAPKRRRGGAQAAPQAPSAPAFLSCSLKDFSHAWPHVIYFDLGTESRVLESDHPNSDPAALQGLVSQDCPTRDGPHQVLSLPPCTAQPHTSADGTLALGQPVPRGLPVCPHSCLFPKLCGAGASGVQGSSLLTPAESQGISRLWEQTGTSSVCQHQAHPDRAVVEPRCAVHKSKAGAGPQDSHP